MTEEYRTIAGFENYQVSNLGNVRSLNYRRTGMIQVLNPGQHRDGYLQVGLHKNRKKKMFKVHRLVASAFIPNPSNLPEINHKNEIKTDNRLENLEWVSHKENLNYGTHNQRMAEAQRGKKRKPHTEETKRKMSEARKRYCQSKKS